MATCYRCGAPTQMYNIDLPICFACADALAAKPKPVQNEVQLTLPHE